MRRRRSATTPRRTHPGAGAVPEVASAARRRHRQPRRRARRFGRNSRAGPSQPRRGGEAPRRAGGDAGGRAGGVVVTAAGAPWPVACERECAPREQRPSPTSDSAGRSAATATRPDGDPRTATSGTEPQSGHRSAGSAEPHRTASSGISLEACDSMPNRLGGVSGQDAPKTRCNYCNISFS